MFNFFKKTNLSDQINVMAAKRNIRLIGFDLTGNRMTISVDWVDKAMNGRADSLAKEVIKKKIASNVLVVSRKNDYIKRYYVGDIIHYNEGTL
jgi:hypothetical protein